MEQDCGFVIINTVITDVTKGMPEQAAAGIKTFVDVTSAETVEASQGASTVIGVITHSPR